MKEILQVSLRYRAVGSGPVRELSSGSSRFTVILQNRSKTGTRNTVSFPQFEVFRVFFVTVFARFETKLATRSHLHHNRKKAQLTREAATDELSCDFLLTSSWWP